MTDPTDPLADLDPEHRAAIAALLAPPDPLAELRRQVRELQCRLEDLTVLVADLQRRLDPEEGQPWIA